MLFKKLEKKVSKMDFAFQPIVDIYTGDAIAYEALLRDYDKAGYKSIDSVFDNAYKRKTLHALDLLLREKVLVKIKPIYEKNKNFQIFYNLDNRIIDMDNLEHGMTKKLLSKHNYDLSFFTFEISEKHQFKSFEKAQAVFEFYSNQGFNIALDDFGIGYSGLKTLYYLDPQYIKIDRFFIKDILTDKKKKLFLTNIINIAHQSGIKVLAEGVETYDELKACRDIGCDLAQGYYIQRPVTNIDELKFEYLHIKYAQKMGEFEQIKESDVNLDYIYQATNIYSKIFDKYVISTKTDLKGNITDATDAFCKISGFYKEDLIGAPHTIVKEKDFDKKLYKQIRKSIKNGETWQGLVKNISKCGAIYYLETSIYPQYNEDSTISGYASICNDVTSKYVTQ